MPFDKSSESWPAVARSDASTSIRQWHLGKVFTLNSPSGQKYVYITKSIFICVFNYLIRSFGEHLIRYVGLSAFCDFFFLLSLFFGIMYST